MRPATSSCISDFGKDWRGRAAGPGMRIASSVSGEAGPSAAFTGATRAGDRLTSGVRRGPPTPRPDIGAEFDLDIVGQKCHSTVNRGAAFFFFERGKTRFTAEVAGMRKGRGKAFRKRLSAILLNPPHYIIVPASLLAYDATPPPASLICHMPSRNLSRLVPLRFKRCVLFLLAKNLSCLLTRSKPVARRVAGGRFHAVWPPVPFDR